MTFGIDRDGLGSFTDALITVLAHLTARQQGTKDNHMHKYKNFNQNVICTRLLDCKPSIHLQLDGLGRYEVGQYLDIYKV